MGGGRGQEAGRPSHLLLILFPIVFGNSSQCYHLPYKCLLLHHDPIDTQRHYNLVGDKIVACDCDLFEIVEILKHIQM